MKNLREGDLKSSEQHGLSVNNKKAIVFPFPASFFFFFPLGLLNSLTTDLWDCFSFKERRYALFTNVASPSC